MCELMPAVARRKIALSTDGSGSCNIVGGLAIVENAYDQTMLLEGIAASQIEAREPMLLKLACEHMPRLCVEKLDVLLLDHTGKNISGTGMDTNIVGRVLNPGWDGFTEPTTPVIKAIGIHRLAGPSHGNGGGMGLADIISRKFFESLDLELTWKHMVSCNWTVGGKIPGVLLLASVAQRLPLSARISPAGARWAERWRACCLHRSGGGNGRGGVPGMRPYGGHPRHGSVPRL
jgi:hypothetical protein